MNQHVKPELGSYDDDSRASTFPPLPPFPCCLFLDVDGTLLDLAATPEAVSVSDDLLELLAVATRRLDGAVGLVSGRPIGELDRLFRPLRLPVAGVHGAERRDPEGQLYSRPRTDVLSRARTQLQAFVATHPGLLLEDKQSGLALHFRLAPHLQDLVRTIVEPIAAQLSPEFRLLEGDKVLEIKPADCTKGTAIEAFLDEAPFAGRIPVFIGDDVTDLDGFAAVQRRGGMAIAVGPRVQASWNLADPRAVHEWLRKVIDRGCQ